MVEVVSRSDYVPDEEMVRKVVSFVVEMEGKEGDVSVAFVNVQEMTYLNETYRHKEGPTDVLSFPYGDEMLGEIVICPEVVRENSERFGSTFEDEMLLTLVHASLHLCGYDHERSTDNAQEMFEKQKEYFERLKGML